MLRVSSLKERIWYKCSAVQRTVAKQLKVHWELSLRTLIRKYLRALLWVTTPFHFELLGAPMIEWEPEWSCGWDIACGWSRQIQLKPQAFRQHSTMWTILRLQENTQASENSTTTTVELIETNIDSKILPHHRLCEISTIYPITVDNYPTPLFYVVYGTR